MASRRSFLKSCMAVAALQPISAIASLIRPLQSGNVIQRENEKQGTTTWQRRDPASNREIEGYASATSINRGESIQFFVSTTDPSYSMEVFRMGWYGGAGARLMTDPVSRMGFVQELPATDPASGLIECNWSDPYTLSVPGNPGDPTDWASGIYVVKLTGTTSGKSSYIMFVVRDDRRPSALLMQSCVTRYQAYNNWGGKSLYNFNSLGGPARKVSFDRPYAGNGTAEFLRTSGWEYNILRFLEKEGYDVAYSTNLDTHRDGPQLLLHRGFLSVGHDEYWSWEMRNNVETALARGVHLAFFSANTCYWQIRLESNADGQPYRRMTSYKEAALAEDPLARDGDPSNDHLVTTLWRNAPVNRPEEELIGVMYGASPVDGDIIIDDDSHWIFANSGLSRGSRLSGLLGYEVDRIHAAQRPSLVRLAHSPFTAADGETGFSDMTIYTASSGATVFATGSMQWAWGLDDWNATPSRLSRVHPGAQQMTRNLLNRFSAGSKTARRRAARRGA